MSDTFDINCDQNKISNEYKVLFYVKNTKPILEPFLHCNHFYIYINNKYILKCKNHHIRKIRSMNNK